MVSDSGPIDRNGKVRPYESKAYREYRDIPRTSRWNATNQDVLMRVPRTNRAAIRTALADSYEECCQGQRAEDPEIYLATYLDD